MFSEKPPSYKFHSNRESTKHYKHNTYIIFLYINHKNVCFKKKKKSKPFTNNLNYLPNNFLLTNYYWECTKSVVFISLLHGFTTACFS